MNMDLISASRSLVEEAWNNPDKRTTNLAYAEAKLSKALVEVAGNVLALPCLGAMLSDQGKHEEAASALARSGTRGNPPEHLFQPRRSNNALRHAQEGHVFLQ